MQRRQQSLLSFFQNGANVIKQEDLADDDIQNLRTPYAANTISPSNEHAPRKQTGDLHGISSSNANTCAEDALKQMHKSVQAAEERMRSLGPPYALDSSIPGIKRIREDHDGYLLDHCRISKRKMLMNALGEGEEQKGLWEEAKAKFEWLNPSKARDSKGRKPGEPFFDRRTLKIPSDAFNKMSASQKQYWEVKCKYMDTVLFFKLGKFYELYELDAEVGHRELNWKMTVSGVGKCRQVGVPESGIEDAVEKLLARGYKVGRIEQVETAEQAKAKRGPGAMVKRELTQVLTPSTAMDENMKPEAVHLLALREELDSSPNSCGVEKSVFGFAFVDAAAGQFYIGSLHDDDARSALGALLTQVAPQELLYEMGGLSDETKKALRRYSSQASMPLELTPLQPTMEFMEASRAMKMMESHGYFKSDNNHPGTSDWIEVLMTVGDCNAAAVALGALVQHLVRLKVDTTFLESGLLASYEVYEGSLRLDGQTLSNLEIFNNNADGCETGTLFSFLNNCSTAFGKRLLRKWICHPLQRLEEINGRLDAIDDFRNHPDLVGVLRASLQKLPDLERLISQIHRACASASSDEATIPLLSNREKKRKVQAFSAVVKGLLSACNLLKVIMKGDCDGPVRSHLLLAMSNVKGITEAHDSLVSMAVHVGQKFWSPKKKSAKQDFVLDEEDSQLLNALLLEFNHHHACWRKVTANLAQLDVLLSLMISMDGANGPTCRPAFVPSSKSRGGAVLKVEELWHPYAAGVHSGVFVRNNVELGSDCSTSQRAMLLTGPNMGGKSTLLRATCLAVILAQMGCYVPAEACILSPVDIIFTRLGASDRIMSGESTFMVECMEASSVLRYASPDSLVILDELGRGTSTFDGYAIAYSVLRHMVDTVDCRLLFATHYHPLTKEFGAHPSVNLHHMACAFRGGEAMNEKRVNTGKVARQSQEKSLVFLYKLSPGASPDSYGLHVASLAGIPRVVVERAEQARNILHSRLSATFQKNAHRVHFSHVHDQWLRTLLAVLKLDASNCNATDMEDVYDTLVCVWHELQSCMRAR